MDGEAALKPAVETENRISYTGPVKKALRIFALALLAVPAVAGAFLLMRGSAESGRGEAATFERFSVPETHRSCRECHEEIYDQWEKSFHALAWDDPQLQVPGIRLKEKPDCWPCHIPAPVFLSTPGMLPQARSSGRSEGVNCSSCHYTPEGMAGRSSSDVPPCKPRVKPEIASMALCSGCHNQHKTHDEWASSSYYPDTDCNDCHMPFVEGVATKGKPIKKYRAHSWSGANDLDWARKAFTLSALVETGEGGALVAVVDLVNDGAGHNFPTDARFHRADIKIDVVLPTGETVNQFEEKFKNPFRGMVGVENTQIKPGEKKHYRIPLRLPQGLRSGTLRVRVLYCLQPYPGKVSDRLEDNKYVILEELRVDF